MAEINPRTPPRLSLSSEIKQLTRRGSNVSHILHVNISTPPKDLAIPIRHAIFRIINEERITKEVDGVPVSITWRSSAQQTSAHFYCDVNGMFGDRAVNEHTKLLLRDVVHQLDPQFGNIFANGDTGVSFVVTRPLVLEVAIGVEDLALPDEDVDPHA